MKYSITTSPLVPVIMAITLIYQLNFIPKVCYLLKSPIHRDLCNSVFAKNILFFYFLVQYFTITSIYPMYVHLNFEN